MPLCSTFWGMSSKRATYQLETAGSPKMAMPMVRYSKSNEAKPKEEDEESET